MFDRRSRFHSLVAVALAACMSFASVSFERVHRVIDSLAHVARSAFAFTVNLFLSFASPARADELAPLERAKLTASESRTLAAVKRERPVIFAGWRMSPST